MSAQIIKQLSEQVGSQAELARRIKAAPALVYQWATDRRPVSPRYALEIESQFRVSRHLIRPDVFGPAVEAEVDPDVGRIVPVESA